MASLPRGCARGRRGRRRLLSNTHALYQYCPVPRIMYPELEHELFCNIYYLRHLCDTAKFPNWDIKKPVRRGYIHASL